ncbi:hypothetical protein SDC9_149133 [bioreactor metagenome]|uniref:Uncharacterized protein n=1 Tax=bioreactor metagenome TaxID=1076179 RepID=A0A645EKS3_9ZZZZ
MQISQDPLVWLGAFVTLSILSFVFWNDSPFYNYVQSAYLGVAAGVTVVVGWSNIKNQVITPLMNGNYSILIPVFLGLLLLVRYIPGLNWVARYPVAVLVAGGAGLGLANTVQAQFVSQIKAGLLPLNSFDNILMFVGLLAVIAFFFLTGRTTHVMEKLKLGWVTRLGRIVLMVAFGASFGTTVMGRCSILIGRLQFLLTDFLGL